MTRLSYCGTGGFSDVGPKIGRLPDPANCPLRSDAYPLHLYHRNDSVAEHLG